MLLLALLFPIALIQIATASGSDEGGSPSAPNDGARPPRAMIDTAPLARIRSPDRARGLTFDGFARWRNRYPELVALPPSQAGLSPAADAAQRRAILRGDFADADIDRDDVLSATELADWIARN